MRFPPPKMTSELGFVRANMNSSPPGSTIKTPVSTPWLSSVTLVAAVVSGYVHKTIAAVGARVYLKEANRFALAKQ
jgi:hypothetical protein